MLKIFWRGVIDKWFGHPRSIS